MSLPSVSVIGPFLGAQVITKLEADRMEQQRAAGLD
jgi:hypothetical protein